MQPPVSNVRISCGRVNTFRTRILFESRGPRDPGILGPVNAPDRDLIAQLLATAGLGRALAIDDAGSERGVFSTVWRVTVEPGHETAIAKLPVGGRNGTAARMSGAYRRELLAYRELLDGQPLHPAFLSAVADDDDGVAFLLEDLGAHRAVDQLDGLGLTDALAVVDELAILHRDHADSPGLGALSVRRSAPSNFDPDQLAVGLEAMDGKVDDQTQQAFAAVLDNRPRLLAAFADITGSTLCHGDPRADNVVFRSDGRAVLFDWQQLAIQHGEADLAWLLATSVTTLTRKKTETEAIAHYGELIGRTTAEATERYRLGLLLPALAVLLLAQREVGEGRAATMVATSIQRIAAAVVDLEVAAL